MTRNYFYKGKLVGQDCRYCGKRVNLREPHQKIDGVISYVAHLNCPKKDKLKALIKQKIRGKLK